MKKQKHYIKKFKKAKDNETRKEMLAHWVMGVFSEFHKISQGFSPRENQFHFERMDIEARKFCSRPIVENEWCLDKYWLRLIISHLGKEESTMKMFLVLGWDFDKARNPKSDDTHTIQEFLWVDSDNDDEVIIPFLLESKGHLSTGSKWKMGKGTGNHWELQFANEKEVEIINEAHTLVRTIKRSQFVSQYKKVG